MQYSRPDLDQGENPLRVILDSSGVTQAPDIDVRLELFEEGSTERCGEDGTLCATVDLDRLPKHIDAVLSQTEDLAGAGVTHGQLDLDLTLEPQDDPPQLAPDLALEATIGPNTLGLDSETPLVLEAALDKLPERTKIRMRNTRSPVGELPDPDDIGPETEFTTNLDSVDVHTCDWNFEGEQCNEGNDERGQPRRARNSACGTSCSVRRTSRPRRRSPRRCTHRS